MIVWNPLAVVEQSSTSIHHPHSSTAMCTPIIHYMKQPAGVNTIAFTCCQIQTVLLLYLFFIYAITLKTLF